MRRVFWADELCDELDDLRLENKQLRYDNEELVDRCRKLSKENRTLKRRIEFEVIGSSGASIDSIRDVVWYLEDEISRLESKSSGQETIVEAFKKEIRIEQLKKELHKLNKLSPPKIRWP